MRSKSYGSRTCTRMSIAYRGSETGAGRHLNTTPTDSDADLLTREPDDNAHVGKGTSSIYATLSHRQWVGKGDGVLAARVLQDGEGNKEGGVGGRQRRQLCRCVEGTPRHRCHGPSR